MATTTNFGWETPDDTDLVKDGAAAIRTALGGVDTSFVDLKGGTTGQILSKASNTDLDYTWITNEVGDITGVTAGTGISGGGTSGTVTVTNSMATEITAAGDIIVGTGSGTFDNLPIGTTGQILTADTTVSPYKVKWATPASGGSLTLISTTSLSGASVTLSSIPGTYKKLYAVAYGVTNAGGAGFFRIAPNGTTNITTLAGLYNNGSVATDGSKDSYLQVGRGNATTGGANVYVTIIDNYASSANYKAAQLYGVMFDSGSNNDAFTYTGGITTNTAITSLVLSHSGGNFNAGTIDLYGVN